MPGMSGFRTAPEPVGACVFLGCEVIASVLAECGDLGRQVSDFNTEEERRATEGHGDVERTSRARLRRLKPRRGQSRRFNTGTRYVSVHFARSAYFYLEEDARLYGDDGIGRWFNILKNHHFAITKIWPTRPPARSVVLRDPQSSSVLKNAFLRTQNLSRRFSSHTRTEEPHLTETPDSHDDVAANVLRGSPWPSLVLRVKNTFLTNKFKYERFLSHARKAPSDKDIRAPRREASRSARPMFHPLANLPLKHPPSINPRPRT
jgi:hypothetical protein